ncbi:MAG TPA: hypothetical protein VE889_04775 [Actinomycetota bacterium]|nr:hypothetical protein [Actinomycetota bacterium]
MDAWVVVLLVVIVVAIAVAAWTIARKKRTEDLRGRFGPEYNRAMEDRGDRREAEKDLKARAERRSQLDIRPLAPETRTRYAQQWKDVQTRFVDDPSNAVGEADELVIVVMTDRGYPMDDFDQRAADVSVDHPRVVESYRAAHTISIANANGRAGTEDLRQALVHYRALFQELLGEDEGAPGRTEVDLREERRTGGPLR